MEKLHTGITILNTCKTNLVLLIAIATSSFILGTNAKAQSDIEDIYRFRGPAKHIYSQIEFLPILEMIQPWRRPRVERALSERDCGIAVGHLYQSIFYNTHKYVASPFNSSKGLTAWLEYILPQHYPDLQFCLTVQKIEKAEKYFRSKGSAPLFLKQNRDPGRDPLVDIAQSGVYSALSDLIILAIEDYPPAQLMLVKLSRQKRHLRLTRPMNISCCPAPGSTITPTLILRPSTKPPKPT